MSAAETYTWQAPETAQASRASMQSFDFDADDWYFYEYAPGKGQNVRQIHIHFADAAGWQVKKLLKQYAAWRLGRVRPVTVRLEMNGRLCHWLRYLRVRQIADPRAFGMGELERFGQWLRMQDTQKQACARILHTVIDLLRTGQRLGWQVTEDRLSENFPCAQQAQMAAAYPEGAKTEPDEGSTDPIPSGIYEQILRHAVFDEPDAVTRGGIIIQSQTGLRISEVLSLRAGCLKRDRHGSWLTYSLKKTTKAEPQQRFVPANELVCEAVGRLQAATEALRQESGRTELFLIRNHGIRQVSQTNWNKGRLRSFLRRWNITDENGGEYELHSHQFRATYVREQLLAGGQIEQIQRRFGHVSPEMTARYVHLSEEAMLAILSPSMGMMGR